MSQTEPAQSAPALAAAPLDKAPPAAEQAAAAPDCPYVGLQPYTEADRAYFFGREQEQETIAANLIGAPLTLFYGASGVGKSSVLSAGVVPYLRQLPSVVVVNFRTWQDATFKQVLMDAVGREVAAIAGKPFYLDAPLPFDEFLRAAALASRRTLLVILDQFEEYFLYHPDADPFDTELARAVNRDEVTANLLFSLREDALSRLDRFEARIPNLYSNYLRLEPLGRDGAISAIRKPLEVYNRRHPGQPPVTIEDGLVAALLDQVQTGRVALGSSGAAPAGTSPDALRIETPVLQMVMTRLWAEERASGSNVLRLSTLERLGGATHIAHTHVDNVMSKLSDSERDVAANVLRYLVTPSATKIALSVTDLADFSGLPPDRLEPVLKKLAGGDVRILRPVAPPLDQPKVERYEIYHDVLAPAILDWRRRYITARDQAEAEKRLAGERLRVARLRLGIFALSLLLLLTIGLAVFALNQREAAQQATRLATSRELAAQSLAQLEKDPELSLLLAVRAAQAGSTLEADDALRRSLTDSRVREVLRGHTDELNDAEFSPDGSLIATASQDKTARLWNAQTGASLFELRGHTGEVLGVQFSPDGKLLLTASRDGTARVWDTKTGASIAVLGGFTGEVTTALFSPYGNMIVVASKDGTARVWQTSDWKQTLVLRGHTDAVNKAIFSPDGKLIATAGDDNTARLWDAATGQSLHVLSGHQDRLLDLAFNPESSLLVTASSDHTALVWDVTRGITQTALLGHKLFISNVAFSPDGKLIATASRDNTGRIWNAKTGRTETILTGHTSRLTSISFSPDGKFVLTSSRDGTARVWDVSTGLPVTILRGHIRDLFSAAFSPDGRYVVTASRDSTARVWETTSAVAVLRAHKGSVNSAVYSPDGRQILTAGNDGLALTWDPTKSVTTSVQVREAKGVDIHNAVYSPDGKLILTADSDKTTRLWDAASGRLVLSIPGAVSLADFAPDGRRFVTVNFDETAKKWVPGVWETATGRSLVSLPAADAQVFAAAFSPDGKLIATATGLPDDAVRIFNSEDGQPVKVLTGHAGPVRDVAFSPDGKHLVSASEDMDARLWDLDSGSYVPLVGHTNWVLTAAFNSDGRFVVTAGRDETARVWEAATGRNLATFRGHTDQINSAVFSPDGRWVLTASADRTAQIYSCEVCGSIQDLLALAQARVTRDLSCSEEDKYLHMDLPCPTPAPEPRSDSGQ